MDEAGLAALDDDDLELLGIQFDELRELSSTSPASVVSDNTAQAIARLESERAQVLARLDQIDRELLGMRGHHTVPIMCVCVLTLLLGLHSHDFLYV